MRVLLSGACGPIFHDYYQYLIGQGIEVLGMDIRSNPFTESLLGNNFLLGPSVSEHPTRYIDFLNENIDRFDYFFPYADEELPVLSSISQKSNLADKVVVSNYNSVNVCLNKTNFYHFLKESNILTPLDSTHKKKIIRPIFGRGGRNIFTVDDEELVRPFRNSEDWIVSDYIDGIEYSVDLVGDGSGGVVDAISRIRVVAKGVSIEAKISIDSGVINLAKEIVQKLALFGPINVQIIKEKNTGKLYVIETNPRLSGGAVFSSLAGLDLIKATVDFIECNEVKITPKKNEKIFCRYWCR